MGNEIQKKRNKCNRKRGSRFEKVVADYLDMDVVPYSGSNARFGYGDVRDSVWLCECKNITPDDGRVKIKQEWIDDNISKAAMYCLSPFVAWMPAGRAEKYIVFDADTFTVLGVQYDITVEIPKKSVVAVNMFIDINEGWIKPVRTGGKIVRLKFGEQSFYMMSIEKFRDVRDMAGLKGKRQTYAKCDVCAD